MFCLTTDTSCSAQNSRLCTRWSFGDKPHMMSSTCLAAAGLVFALFPQIAAVEGPIQIRSMVAPIWSRVPCSCYLGVGVRKLACNWHACALCNMEWFGLQCSCTTSRIIASTLWRDFTSRSSGNVAEQGSPSLIEPELPSCKKLWLRFTPHW